MTVNLLPNLMYQLCIDYAIAINGRPQNPDATIPEIKGFDDDTRRQIGWMIEAVPKESLDFVKDECLVERLMCQRVVSINPMVPRNDDHFDVRIVAESRRPLKDRMQRLEEAWNDNVRITVGPPTANGIDIEFRVTGFDDMPINSPA